MCVEYWMYANQKLESGTIVMIGMFSDYIGSLSHRWLVVQRGSRKKSGKLVK